MRSKCWARSHRPAGGQPVRDVAARTAGAEHPTTVYVGCGDLWTWNVTMNVERNHLMHSEIRKVRAAKGVHALRVSCCV